MKHVLIIYKFLPHYRVDFYRLLKDSLLEHDITLHVVHGRSNKQDALKNDEVAIEWAQYIPNRRYAIRKKEMLWQPCLRQLRGKDLVIVQPESKLLLNYYLMLTRHFFSYKLAFWGHVYNMQERTDTWGNKLKFLLLHNCHWWFGYTVGAKKMLIKRGYPEHKITAVQNAIDTLLLRESYARIDHSEVTRLKNKLGITGCNVGVFCGGMYPNKDIDFILESCFRIKKEIPDFHMLFIGAGIESDKVKKAAADAAWIHYLGPRFGVDRIIYFKLSSVQLMPGLVGLCILDSFALETPIITTEHPFHSPEIEYLENGTNGLMTKYDVTEYAGAVIEILKTGKYHELVEAGRSAAEKYTVQNMVGHFKSGILSCLQDS